MVIVTLHVFIRFHLRWRVCSVSLFSCLRHAKLKDASKLSWSSQTVYSYHNGELLWLDGFPPPGWQCWAQQFSWWWQRICPMLQPTTTRPASVKTGRVLHRYLSTGPPEIRARSWAPLISWTEQVSFAVVRVAGSCPQLLMAKLLWCPCGCLVPQSANHQLDVIRYQILIFATTDIYHISSQLMLNHS